MRLVLSSILFACACFYSVARFESGYDECLYVHYQDTIEGGFNLYYAEHEESILIHKYSGANYDVIYLDISDSSIRAKQRALSQVELFIDHEHLFSCDSIKMHSDEYGVCTAFELNSPFSIMHRDIFLIPVDTLKKSKLFAKYTWLPDKNSQTEYNLCESAVSTH